jgi:hypothetical protein
MNTNRDWDLLTTEDTEGTEGWNDNANHDWGLLTTEDTENTEEWNRE